MVQSKNKKVRVTSVSPGVVKTDIFKAAGLTAELEEEVFTNPHLYPEDIADNILHLLSTPYHVNITEITIRPTGEAI